MDLIFEEIYSDIYVVYHVAVSNNHIRRARIVIKEHAIAAAVDIKVPEGEVGGCHISMNGVTIHRPVVGCYGEVLDSDIPGLENESMADQ